MNPRFPLILALGFIVVVGHSRLAAQTNTFPASGNVGIGTLSPDAPLTVGTGAYAFKVRPYTTDIDFEGYGGGGWARSFRVGNSEVANYRYAAFGALGGPDGLAYAFIAAPSNTDDYQVGYDSVSKLVLLPNGNVGIGTTTPAARLDVVGGGVNLPGGSASGTQNPYPGVITHFNHSDGKNYIRGTTVIADTGGNVGIGTTHPDQKLTIKGGGIGFDYNSADKKLYSPADGDLEWMTHDWAGVHGFAVSHQGEKRVYLNTSGASYFMGGNVGVGETNPQHKLAVNGTIKAKEVIVETTGWSDYVFAEDYRLAPLAEVEAHIKTNKHLPGIPSAAQVAEQGVSVGEMQARLLAKVEELTLHLIAQQKTLETLQSQNAVFQVQNAALQARLQRLETP